jgi:hypothetical protein
VGLKSSFCCEKGDCSPRVQLFVILNEKRARELLTLCIIPFYKRTMPILKVTLALLALAFLASCGKDSSNEIDESVSKVKMRYQFIVNGCDTGEHQFEGSDPAWVLQQLCSALQDDRLNRHCAYSTRSKYYASRCE